ncbi:MAG TPA: TetR/AcrR family transcriptional regulator [Acidimicrobiia bacterium]|nr:TetR/AcrR family transcriptional regulator [Acidimicrobiia bacterium]
MASAIAPRPGPRQPEPRPEPGRPEPPLPESGARRPGRSPARRLAVLHAAAEAFAQAGYAATSMEEIAATAGITKLIVYRHFQTKETLYRAVLEQVFDRQVELFLANITNGLEAEGSTRALLAVAREWPDGFRLLWRHAAREPQFGEYALSLRDVAVNAAREVVTPRVAPPLAEWAAQTLFDHLVDAVLDWLDHGDADHDDDFVTLETAAIRATVGAWAASSPLLARAPR